MKCLKKGAFALLVVSAMPYVDFTALTDDEKNNKKAFAIALIFYKGAGLNSGSDTTISRTLGVGLKHNRSGLVWCLSSANAYNINITTIQCPASESPGSLNFTGDKNGSDNLVQIEDFEGVDDTATATNYPAFYFAKIYSTTAINLGTSYADGWYLPSIAELFQIVFSSVKYGMYDIIKLCQLFLMKRGTDFSFSRMRGILWNLVIFM